MEKEFVGQICWFENQLGYGFISRENEKDIFVHFSDINCEGFKTVKKGQKVTFSIGENKRGHPKAINVTTIK
jgi:CspA family cold shock protein